MVKTLFPKVLRPFSAFLYTNFYDGANLGFIICTIQHQLAICIQKSKAA